MIHEAKIIHQDGLNEVVKNKVSRMLEKKKPTILQTIEQMKYESGISNDFTAPIGVDIKKAGSRPVVTFESAEAVHINMNSGSYSIHPHAIGHLAQKLGIPVKYLRELATGNDWQKFLASEILNTHSGNTPRSRVLIRAVGQEVRAVLSENYRRLNSLEILTAFVQTAKNQGAEICDAHLSDTKVWAETILPEPIQVPTAKNGTIIMYFGARFSTSDYGDGAVDMRAFLMNGVCLNGMVRENLMRQIHLGSKLPADMRLSERTYELDTQATVSAIRDITTGLFDAKNIREKAIEIQLAANKEVDFTTELNRIVKNGGLMKAESEDIQKLLMRNSAEDGLEGQPTLWKLTQSITAVAREMEPVRRRELQELSGELMNRIKL